MTKFIGAHILNKDGTPKKPMPDPSEASPKRKSSESKPNKKTPKTSSKDSPSTKKKKKEPYRGSQELADFLGDEINSFFTITKHIWVYIKKHDLQDPKDKRIIICDDKLRELFGVDRFSQFHMSRNIKKHFFDPDDDSD